MQGVPWVQLTRVSVPQGTTSSARVYHGVQLTCVRALEVHGICIPGGAFEVRCDQGTRG